MGNKCLNKNDSYYRHFTTVIEKNNFFLLAHFGHKKGKFTLVHETSESCRTVFLGLLQHSTNFQVKILGGKSC